MSLWKRRRREPERPDELKATRAKIVQLCPLPGRCPHCKRRTALPIVGNLQWQAAQRGMPVVCAGCKKRLNGPSRAFDPNAFRPTPQAEPEPSRAAPSDGQPSSASTSDARKPKRSFLDNVRTTADAVLTKEQQGEIVEAVSAELKAKLGGVLDGIF